MEQDQHGKIPFYWGITADGYVAFADDAELLRRSCGKSLAPFPQGDRSSSLHACAFVFVVSFFLFYVSTYMVIIGLCGIGCFFSTALSGLMSYENPKNKVTAEYAEEEEICGAKFKVPVI